MIFHWNLNGVFGDFPTRTAGWHQREGRWWIITLSLWEINTKPWKITIFHGKISLAFSNTGAVLTSTEGTNFGCSNLPNSVSCTVRAISISQKPATPTLSPPHPPMVSCSLRLIGCRYHCLFPLHNIQTPRFAQAQNSVNCNDFCSHYTYHKYSSTC